MSEKIDAYTRAAFWHEKPEAWHEIMPGVRRRILGHSSTGMMVLYKIEPNKVFPLHNHPHAQFGYIVEGGGKFKVGDSAWNVKTGDTYYIPPGLPHELVTDGGKPSIIVDFFTPERDDLLPESVESDRA